MANRPGLTWLGEIHLHLSVMHVVLSVNFSFVVSCVVRVPHNARARFGRCSCFRVGSGPMQYSLAV